MKLESKYDAVVIGGGPAGSEFSRVAAKGGMQVLVLEKKKEIGSPVRCGEGITSNWEKKLGLPFTPASIGAKISGIAVHAPNGHKLVLQTAQSTGYVLERKVFDKQLAINAARAGAHYSPRTIATELVKKNGKITGVKASKEGEEFEVSADLIVCAEGMEAIIARQAGFAALSKLPEVDTCYEYEMANVPHDDLIEVYFGNKIAPRGYVWMFPKGKDVANVGIGIGGATGGNPKALLDEFISKNKQFQNAEPIEIKGGIISVAAPQKELVKDNAMVIGTCAHQVDSIHGGGIGLAIEAGYLAGKAAVAAFEKKDYSKTGLASYEKEWWQVQGPKLEKRLKMRHFMEKLSDDDFSAILGSMNSESLDQILSGDFAAAIKQTGRFGKLFLTKPHLLGAFKTLL